MVIAPFTDSKTAREPPMDTWLSSNNVIAYAQSAVARQFKLETEPRLHLWLDASPVIGQDRGLAVFGDSRRFYTYKWYPDGQTEATASDTWPLSAIEWPNIRVGGDQIDSDIR